MYTAIVVLWWKHHRCWFVNYLMFHSSLCILSLFTWLNGSNCIENPVSTAVPILQGHYTQDEQGGYWTGKVCWLCFQRLVWSFSSYLLYSYLFISSGEWVLEGKSMERRAISSIPSNGLQEFLFLPVHSLGCIQDIFGWNSILPARSPRIECTSSLL